jgi:beta-glucosidase
MVAIKQITLLAGLTHLIGAAQNVITDDSHFYGQSPPVYPSRMFSIGRGSWIQDSFFDTDTINK